MGATGGAAAIPEEMLSELQDPLLNRELLVQVGDALCTLGRSQAAPGLVLPGWGRQLARNLALLPRVVLQIVVRRAGA